MAYVPLSQRDRSTSLQRAEQNGRTSRFAGAPQLGQLWAWAASRILSLSAVTSSRLFRFDVGSIEPTVVNWQSLTGEQHRYLGQWQADDVGI